MRTTFFIYTVLLLIAGITFVAWARGGREEKKPENEAPAMMMMMTGGEGTAMPPPGILGGEYVKPSKDELRKSLTALQYKVTQEDGTERAFSDPMHSDKSEGIFVDIVSGEPLFSSLDKFDSGTGWPSFTRPLEVGNVEEVEETAHSFYGTEVRSHFADSHLGHVFTDGPKPTGLRYCINGAALRFIPVDKLMEEGYGRYLPLFEAKS